MAWVAERPRWFVAGLLLVLVVAAYTALTLPISEPEQLELMRDSRFMRSVPQDVWQERYEASLEPTLVKRVTAGAGYGVTTWVMTLIFGAVLTLFARLSGGRAKLRQTLGVVSWAALIPFGLGSLLKLPLVLIQESAVRVTLGLGAFASGLDPLSFGFQALVTYGDFGSWWGLVVIAVGLEENHGLSRGSAATVTILTWLLLISIPFGFGRVMM
jgi:hypothetical protein